MQASHRKLIQNSALRLKLWLKFFKNFQDTPALSWKSIRYFVWKKIQDPKNTIGNKKKHFLMSSIESVCTHIFFPVSLLVTCSGNPQQPRRDNKLP